MVMASQMLGQAFFRAGMYPQCYSLFGGERRGAPVVSFLRVDKEKILLKCEIKHANQLLCFDESLLNPPEIKNVMRPGSQILVCTGKGPDAFEEFKGFSLGLINALAMAYALEVIEQVDRDFGAHFGRKYGLVEAVGLEGAELVLVTTATITSTARVALARLREKGHRVGLVKIRVFRPFPTRLLRKILEPVPRVAVLERNLSLGREGIFCSELKAALVNSDQPHQVQGYLAGIGGTNVDTDLIERVVLDALGRERASDEPIWITEERT